MKITLCGSARFEKQFKELNERLTLRGHVIYSLAVYPSDKSKKNWYTTQQKEILDQMHKEKIRNSDAIVVINVDGYIGESTSSEIAYANKLHKKIFTWYPDHMVGQHMCSLANCTNHNLFGPCARCYE